MEFEKASMKNLSFLCSFPTTYHLHHSDKRLKKLIEITVRPFLIRSDYSIFKIIQKLC
jgi:hypothetical protein